MNQKIEKLLKDAMFAVQFGVCFDSFIDDAHQFIEQVDEVNKTQLAQANHMDYKQFWYRLKHQKFTFRELVIMLHYIKDTPYRLANEAMKE